MTLRYLAVALLLGSSPAAAEDPRPPLLFREDFKQTAAETPITQAHISNAAIVLSVLGPGKAGIRKSHHDQPVDDPYYVWSGTADGNWLVSLRHREFAADLTGLAKIRWRTKQAGFRSLHLVLKTADGTYLISDVADGPSNDWHELEIPISNIRWRALDANRIIEGRWVEHPDLAHVEEIGFTDLMTGGGSDASSRLDWIEVFARSVARTSGK
jgi:hypothetical protein